MCSDSWLHYFVFEVFLSDKRIDFVASKTTEWKKYETLSVVFFI